MTSADEDFFERDEEPGFPRLTTPVLDSYLSTLFMRTVETTGDPVAVEALTRLFAAAEALEDCGGDEARSFWVELERGTYEEYRAERDEDDEDVYDEQEWADVYPDDPGWFRVTLTRYRGAIGLAVNNRGIAVTPGEFPTGRHDPRPWPDPWLRHLLAWLEPAVASVIESVRAGTYNDHVAAHLPYRKRLGKIRRADWWAISPATREWHLGDFTPDEADRLYETVAERQWSGWRERLPEMTVDGFLGACQIGYRAVGAEGCETLTARELYSRHADGRHDGLLDLDPTSPGAFAEWLESGFKGGHPWEILRGGNSTHVSLHVRHDDAGWWFTVDGASAGRSVESARIFLALVAAGLPADLSQAAVVATMLIGADDIGIVPDDVFPRYCQSHYPGESVTDFMNLPREELAATIDRAYWYPIPLVRPSAAAAGAGDGA